MVKRTSSNVEFLVVGNELLNGTVLDTNSHWLSQQVKLAGGRVSRKTTVGDSLEDIASAVRECLARKPSWLFCLGGLGPTYDDMTLRGVSKALEVRTVASEEAVNMLRENINRRRSRMGFAKISRISKASLKMARIPYGAKPLRNDFGSAPGVMIESGETTIACLPGVPPEMKVIVSQEILPMLRKDFSTHETRERWFRARGISESRLAPSLSKIMEKYSPTIYVKSHPIGFDKTRKSLLDIQVIASYRKERAVPALKMLEEAELQMRQAVIKLEGAVLAKKRIEYMRD
jgi:nicotinamide-nucleotide amidase